MIPDDSDDPFVLLCQVSYVELEATLRPCCGDASEVKYRLRLRRWSMERLRLHKTPQNDLGKEQSLSNSYRRWLPTAG